MARSSPFGLFTLVFCLVACICAHGQVSKADATKAVEAARGSAKKVWEEVKGEVRDALRLQNDIDTCKRSAESAATEAEKAAKGNPEAETIAQKAKKASEEALKLYPNASEQAEKYLESMRKLRPKAQELDGKAKNDLFISRWTENNYTKIKEDADAIKSQAEALNTEVNEESSSFSGLYDTQNKILKFVTDAQLARYHIDAIVAVAKIDTLLESAESDIKIIEQKRNEINATVQEMKNLYENSPRDLIHYISSLYLSVEGELSSTSYKIDEAKRAMEYILEQKNIVDDALVKIEAETNVEKAKRKVDIANSAVKKAEEKVEEIKDALESATTSAINALSQKKTAVNELNKNDKKPDVTQENDKTNPEDSSNAHQPMKGTTQSPIVIETKQPTTTNLDQSMSGGAEPTQRVSNDSAMSVCVPLLLALIAYAALH